VNACVESAFEDGRFACNVSKAAAGAKDECPPGLICASDGKCRSRELALTGDGGPLADSNKDGGDLDVTTNPPPDGPIDPCSLAWTATVTERAPSALVLDPEGRLFIGGTSATKKGWIAELNTCDGGTIRERLFDVVGGKEPEVHAMAISGKDIVIGGAMNSGADGLVGRFDRMTFADNASLTSIKGVGLVSIDHIAIADDGAVWLGGAQEIFAATQTGWLIRIPPNGLVSCNLRPSQGVGGLLPDASGRVLVELNEANHTMLLDLAAPNCALTVTGGGPISIQAPNGSGGWFLAGSRQNTIIVGSNGPEPAANERGLIAQRNGMDGTTFTSTFLDPVVGGIDLVVRGVMQDDGTALYAGGTHNATLSGGTPVVYRYALPMTANATPVWSTAPYSGTIAPIQAMVVEPAGKEGVYVTGAQLPNRQQGAIAKCRKTDGCKR
jgi:hypothetical protein